MTEGEDECRYRDVPLSQMASRAIWASWRQVCQFASALQP